MNVPDDKIIQELVASLPKAKMPRDLRAAIEAQTVLKPRRIFFSVWSPAIFGLAAAMGAWFLFRFCAVPRPGMPFHLPLAYHAAAHHPAIAMHHVDESTQTDVLQ
jgi:hypothetical protein